MYMELRQDKSLLSVIDHEHDKEVYMVSLDDLDKIIPVGRIGRAMSSPKKLPEYLSVEFPVVEGNGVRANMFHNLFYSLLGSKPIDDLKYELTRPHISFAESLDTVKQDMFLYVQFFYVPESKLYLKSDVGKEHTRTKLQIDAERQKR